MVNSDPRPDAGLAAEQARNTVEAVYRSNSRHVLATLIRLLGDFDSPKRRCTMPSGRRWSNGRATACPPILAPGWCRPAASRPSMRMRRRARLRCSLDEIADDSTSTTAIRA